MKVLSVQKKKNNIYIYNLIYIYIYIYNLYTYIYNIYIHFREKYSGKCDHLDFIVGKWDPREVESGYKYDAQ